MFEVGGTTCNNAFQPATATMLFVNKYDGNVNFTHGLGGPTRMSATGPLTSLIRPCLYSIYPLATEGVGCKNFFRK